VINPAKEVLIIGNVSSQEAVVTMRSQDISVFSPEGHSLPYETNSYDNKERLA